LLGADNALVTAAEVGRRLATYRPPLGLGAVWRDFVDGMRFAPDVAAGLVDEARVDGTLSLLPRGLATVAYSSTRTTVAATTISGGSKVNTIADRVEVQLDIRTLPGQTLDDVLAMLREAIGDLMPGVEILEAEFFPGSESPQDTPLWEALARVSKGFHPDGYLVPLLGIGGTDNRWMRPTGAVGYGFGLYSRRIGLDELTSMAHGNNERVDVESLDMLTAMWRALAVDFLG